MTITAVIFDLDGTLLDTLEDIAQAFNRVLARRGLSLHPVPAYRAFVGEGAHVLARRALPRALRDEPTVAAVSQEYIDVYGALDPVSARPYAGIPELLDELAARGLPMAVLSNKTHDNTRQCVATLLGRWRFDPVLGLRDGVPRKPDPAAALEIASHLGVPPARMLFVGDTATDIATAASAGMVSAGACWGFRDETELRAAGARWLCHLPEDVLRAIAD
jgi:phosphoglycolate phosphatase